MRARVTKILSVLTFYDAFFQCKLQKISFAFKFQVTIFLFLSPLRILLVCTRGTLDFTNQPITSENPYLDIEKQTWKFLRTFRLFSRNLGICMFLSFRSRKFVTPLFGILRSLGVFILAKCCGSFNKFSTYFLQSLDSSLFFFRKWIYFTYIN